MIKKQLIALLLMLSSAITFAQIGNESQGQGSGVNITSADYVTTYGDSSGYSVTSGSRTTYIGYNAGKSHTVQTDNTFIGAYAGENAITGTDNVFIGTYAGRNCDGTDNTVIGVEAGMSMVSGASDNVIIGEEAGQALLDGDDNVFVGEDAGYNTTTASDNTFVGNTSGRSNTTGFGNAFFGDEAGYDNTTGQWNSALGDSALIDNGVGFNNTAIGHGAGCATEHGDYNTFLGAYAGGDNNRTNNSSNANRNTYVGVFSGFSNREGEDNVGMGAFSGYGSGYEFLRAKPLGQWNGEGQTNRSRTTFLGSQAVVRNDDAIAIGYLARTEGEFGIALGNYSSANQDYAVAIGFNVDVNQPNTMALGGDALTNRLSVGIGTIAANPNASLELADVDKGFLINRLTTAERITMVTTPASEIALTTTDEGLMIYDTDENTLYVWDGAVWVGIANLGTSGWSFNANGTGLQTPTNTASGLYSTAMGTNTQAQGDYSIAMGKNTIAIGNQAVAMGVGSKSFKWAATAMGIGTKARGRFSTTFGGYTDASDFGTLALGYFNTIDPTSNPNNFDLANRALVIGNGPNNGARSDAFTILFDGTTTIAGNVTAPFFIGDGSLLTNLPSPPMPALIISGSELNENILTIGIEGGTSEDVDLEPLLVNLETENATQQTQIDTQQTQISELQAQINTLLSRMTVQEDCACESSLGVNDYNLQPDRAYLLQNVPNPFDNSTNIGYFVPFSYSRANIVISTITGQIVDNITLSKLGESYITINKGRMATATYLYTLFVDGKKIDSRRMVVE